MLSRKCWMNTVALGALAILMTEITAQAQSRPDQPGQPSGSVRYTKKRATRTPGAAGATVAPGGASATRKFVVLR